MLDVTNYRIDPGDDVVFIRNDSRKENQPEIRQGTVQKITSCSVTVLDSRGELCRVMNSLYCQNEGDWKTEKVAVLAPRQRRGGPARDTTGYPVMRGDTVVFRGSIDMRSCRELIAGRVERLTADYAYVFEYKSGKTSRRLISKLAVIEPKQTEATHKSR